MSQHNCILILTSNTNPIASRWWIRGGIDGAWLGAEIKRKLAILPGISYPMVSTYFYINGWENTGRQRRLGYRLRNAFDYCNSYITRLPLARESSSCPPAALPSCAASIASSWVYHS
jgi:hypothetical protein